MVYRLLLLILLGASVGYLVAAWHIPMDPFTAAETVNARTLPLLYGGLLAGSLLVLLGRRTAPHATRPPIDRLLRVAGLGLTLLAFALAVEALNLWVALGGLLLVSALLLGERRWLALIGLATIVPIVGYVAVEQLLGVYLPS